MVIISGSMTGNMSSNDLEVIEIGLLLEGIYRYYGYDFRNYAFSTLRRRIHYRMMKERLSSVSQLQDIVLRSPELMKDLLNDFTIPVTEMFRDPGFFKSFRCNVVPLLKDRPLIRIWHAGCATGEEVYSMAILLHEEGLYDKIVIYATDMNERLLDIAKAGVYPLKKMKLYTNNYFNSGGNNAFSEYYSVLNGVVKIHDFLKKNIVFSQHNLVTDSSFNEFNVIVCRNVLIYFNSLLQERVFKLFYESLGPLGVLGLGKKETIKFNKYYKFFKELDQKENLYQRL